MFRENPSLSRATLSDQVGGRIEVCFAGTDIWAETELRRKGVQTYRITSPRSHLKREQRFETSCHRHGHRVPHRSGFGRQRRREARSDLAALSFSIRGLLHRLAVAESRLCRSQHGCENHHSVSFGSVHVVERRQSSCLQVFARKYM